MTIDADQPVEERLVQLLNHFDLAAAHVAARRPEDWKGFVGRHPDQVTSLTLVCPHTIDTAPLLSVASRTVLITGDQGPTVTRVRQALAAISEARLITLPNYTPQGWSDVAVDHGEAIGDAMEEHLRLTGEQRGIRPVELPEGEGYICGLSYKIRGTGPPLLLLPLDLAPSQWEPLLATLSARYCTITLGGAALGIVALLEKRGHSSYWHVVRSLIDTIDLRAGEAVLEVGCGSGVLVRQLARLTGGANRLVGVDISPYLLREATALAKQAGLEAAITFQEGNAEALPFPDGSFDVTMSCTVLEEGDADKMLAEMVRVTRPGGRVAVVVRTIDMPWWVNAPLGPALKAKVEAPSAQKGSGVAARGCADASIYGRFHAAGLTKLNVFVQFQTVTPAEPRLAGFEQQLLATLSVEEVEEWRNAVTQAKAAGTFFIAMPLHCAVGTKP